MKKDKKKIQEERVTATLNKIVALFESGNVPKAIAMATFPPYEGLPSNEWSLANKLIMLRSDTSDGRGYKQWAEIGRYPRKGSKAFHILAPRMMKRKPRKELENLTNDSQQKAEYFLAGFIPISIFRFEDTEGVPIEYEPIQLPEFPLIEKAKEWNIDVGGLVYHGKFYGYYRDGYQEKIRLASPKEIVFFHEISHAAHRRIIGQLKGKNPKEEIVAELSAQALAQLVGTEMESTLGNSYQYIKQYANTMGKDIGRACMSVLSEVEQVLKLILDCEITEKQTNPARLNLVEKEINLG